MTSSALKSRRLIFIIHNLQLGGAETALYELLKRLAAKNYEIALVTILKEGSLTPKFNRIVPIYAVIRSTWLINLIPRFLFGGVIKRLYTRVCNVRSFLDKNLNPTESDVILLCSDGYLIEKIANYATPCKKIAWIHTDILKHNKYSIAYVKKHYSIFDHIIFVSATQMEIATNEWAKGLRKSLVRNILREQELKDAINLEKNYAPKKVKIVTCARLEKVKNLDFLIESFSIAKSVDPALRLQIIGDGSQKSSLKAKAKSLNLEDVEFLGAIDNPLNVIRDADLFVSTSLYEGNPITVSEASLLGVTTLFPNHLPIDTDFQNLNWATSYEMTTPRKLAENIIKELEKKTQLIPSNLLIRLIVQINNQAFSDFISVLTRVTDVER